MRKNTPEEMERHRIAKTVRSLVRLKHSLAADVELNELLPDTLAEFNDALARGELLELQVGLADVLGGGRAASK